MPLLCALGLSAGVTAQLPVWNALLSEAELAARVSARWSEVCAFGTRANSTSLDRSSAPPQVRSADAVDLGLALIHNRRLLSHCAEARTSVAGSAPTATECAEARELGLRAFAVYDLQRDLILIARHFPHAAQQLARVFDHAGAMHSAPQRAALLDVVLWHELSHALQQRSFDLPIIGASMRGFEARAAFAAVIEGHAQYITACLAVSDLHRAAWQLFARQHEALPDGCAPHAAGSIAACEVSFAYRAGLEFFEGLEQQRGREGLLALVFENPPRTLWHIAHPLAWLQGEVDPGQCLEPALSEFARVGFVRSTWASALENVTPQTLKRALGALEPRRVEDLVGAIQASRVLHVRSREGDERLIFAVLDLGSAERARIFIAAEEEASKSFDALSSTESGLRVSYERAADGSIWIQKSLLHAGETDERSALLLTTLGSLVIELNMIGLADEESARRLVSALSQTLDQVPTRTSTIGK